MNNFKKTFLFLTFFILSTSAGFSAATSKSSRTDVQSIEKLLESYIRPTPLEVLEAFNGVLPEDNPFIDEDETIYGEGENTILTLKALRNYVGQTIPLIAKSIAILEKAYPNAIYFPMGRDAAYYADGLDFFYLTMGEDKRVFRLRASGTTIRSLDEETGPQFLKSNHFLEQPNRPHILIDNTPFASSSQSRALFNYGIQILTSAGIPENELYKHIAVGAPNGWSANADDQANEDKKKRVYSDQTLALGIRAALYGGGFWHRTSDAKLETLPSGEMIGVFNSPYSVDSRRQVLAFIYEVMRAVNSVEFLEMVNKHLKELGVKDRFSNKNRRELNIGPLSPAEIAQRENKKHEKQFKSGLKEYLEHWLHRGFSPGNIKESMDVEELLTKKEHSDLFKSYLVKVKANPKSKDGIELIAPELRLIFSSRIGDVRKLEFIISRLPRGKAIPSQVYSPSVYLLHAWMKSIIQKSGNIPSYEFTKLLFKAYKEKKLLKNDFEVLVSTIPQFVRGGFRASDILHDKVLTEELLKYSDKHQSERHGHNDSFRRLMRDLKEGYKDKSLSCKNILKAG